MIRRNISLLFKFCLPVVLVLLLMGCKSKVTEQVKEDEFYVCSMDPQVMEKQPGMCPICKMPLAKVTIDTKQLHHVQINDVQARLANIKVGVAAISPIGRGTSLNGIFAVNQNKTEQVSARIRGRVDRLYFKIAGSQVRKGDKLYDLYSRELLQAQEEYLLAIEKGKLLSTGSADFVAAARNKLMLWGLNDTQVANLEKTGRPQITQTIYSRVSGIITEIPLKDGDYVNEGGEIYKVADLGSLWVEAQLYTNELAYLQEGQKVEVVPEAFPDDHINGSVVFTNPELQQQSKINLVRIEVSNPNMRYRPGMQAHIMLRSDEKSALVLPRGAVIQNAKNSVVWVQSQKNTFEPRNVTTGIQDVDKIEILSGIKEGDSVVVSGAYLLNSEYIFKRGMNPTENVNITPVDHQNMKM